MMRLTIVLSFLTLVTQAQTDVDYQLYSKVIRNYIDEGLKQQVATLRAVIISKYRPEENWASYYGKQFIQQDEQLIQMSLQYDTGRIGLFKNKEVQAAVMHLEDEFHDSPVLDKNHFAVGVPVSSLSKERFDKYFTGIFGKRIDKGWRKFYRKYPGSHGVFKFSKIIYKGEFACFYVGRHSGGLSASGDLIICRRTSKGWAIVTVVNIWMA